VAGIEPASKEQSHNKSTCLVVFDLSFCGERQSDPQKPSRWS